MAEPIYRRIADDLRLRIESGALAPGGRLPSEPEIGQAYQASRNTIRDAVKLLIGRGLVETRPGQGTFVVEKFDPFVTTLSGDWQSESGLGGGEGEAAFREVEARNRRAFAALPRVGVRRAAGNVASLLGVAAGTSVVSRYQERWIDDQPWSLQISYYPMKLVAAGASRLLDAAGVPEGTVKYLEHTLGVKQVGYRDRILVRPPSETEARFFRLADDARVPVVVLLRTGFAEDPDGVLPYRLTESVFPSDRNQFVINAGEVPDRLADAAEV